MSSEIRSTDLANRAFRSRRLRDLALFLPCVGIFLYMSPIPSLFATDLHLFGVPAIFVFIYGVWLTLIILSARLAKKLSQDQV